MDVEILSEEKVNQEQYLFLLSRIGKLSLAK